MLSDIKEKKKLGVSFLLIFVAMVVATKGYPIYQQSANYHETRILFDTEVYIEAHGYHAKEAVQEALSLMAKVSDQLNMYSTTSEVSLINQAAGQHPVVVSSLTFRAIKKAVEVARMTDGAFDPAIGPLTLLWGIGADGKHNPIPNERQVKETLKLVDYQNIIFNQYQYSIFLSEANMRLDLGAIAKGYAVGQAVEVLKQNNIHSALVSAGGNIYALGDKSQGKPWRIGIRDPEQKYQIIGYVDLVNQGIDTSGDYEQFFTNDEKKYSHVINPYTGYPVSKTLESVVLSSDSALADALSTGISTMDAQQGLKLINNIQGTEGMVIEQDSQRKATLGFKRAFKEAKQ